jgi:hypothetical protein
MSSELTLLTAIVLGMTVLFFVTIGPLVQYAADNFEIKGFSISVETEAKFLDAKGNEVHR